MPQTSAPESMTPEATSLRAPATVAQEFSDALADCDVGDTPTVQETKNAWGRLKNYLENAAISTLRANFSNGLASR